MVVVLHLEQLIQKLKVFGGPFGRGEEQNREEGEMAQKKLGGGRNGEKGSRKEAIFATEPIKEGTEGNWF